MAQASTAGTAILRSGRNEAGGIFLLTDSIRFQEMTPLLQIFSHSPSCSAPNKSPTANYSEEMNVRMELIKIRQGTSSLSQVAVWLTKARKQLGQFGKSMRPWKRKKQLETLALPRKKNKKKPLYLLGPLTWGCQGISQAISFILVSVTEKSTQTLMQLSLWANRGNRNREKRVKVFTIFLVIDASVKWQPNLCAVILINLIVDIFVYIYLILSGAFLRTTPFVHRTKSWLPCLFSVSFPILTMAIVDWIMGGQVTQLGLISFSF